MCGILGKFPGTREEAEKALELIAHRGLDSRNIELIGNGVIGHVLHSLVGDVKQPVRGKGILLFNGEIYNWKELSMSERVDCDNDTQLLLYLLDSYGVDKVRTLIDGVYAYAYINDNTITLERDLLGVKPLWYSQKPFGFASEEKALLELGLQAKELHPRTTLIYDIDKDELSSSVRPLSFNKKGDDIISLLRSAVNKRIPSSNKLGILFSGGIDSSLLALIAKEAGADITLYVAALDDPVKSEPHDLLAAREAAEELGLPLVEIRSSIEEVENLLPELMVKIETANVVKVGVAIPFWFCCEQAKNDGQRVLLSGLGAEEVFAGYQRHKQALDINKECLRGLRGMHERDLYRDDVVGMAHTLEIRLPFLDHSLVAHGLSIPGDEKIVDGLGKMPLRLAAQQIGLSEGIAMRPKKAAQYGSQFDAAIEKLAKQKGMKKAEYLRSLYPAREKLCSLLSSGKDSIYALYTLQRMNYDIACCATVISTNPDSYMYHTPVASLAEKQSELMGVPWIYEVTDGEKEAELDALRILLQRAIDDYGVSGVVSGALYSDYQRSRIEKVSEELGLRVFSPLWHLDQEQEVREILDAGFTFILSKVAAEGLDKSYVGRPITHDDIDFFKSKLHLNVAGEGGEYESLVIDGPNFSEPIDISGFQVVCEKTGSVEVCELQKPK